MSKRPWRHANANVRKITSGMIHLNDPLPKSIHTGGTISAFSHSFTRRRF